jgi:hypothetical protein
MDGGCAGRTVFVALIEDGQINCSHPPVG